MRTLISRRSALSVFGLGAVALTVPQLLAGCAPGAPGTTQATWTPYGRVASAQQAADIVLAQAQDSVALGSNGVGGMILHNPTGTVIQLGRNERYRPLDLRLSPGQTFTWDYTAHGETGLVLWYQKNQQALGLPPASECTIVTSLDPCAMCTGSIMTGGFTSAVVASDATGGMNLAQDLSYGTLPAGLREAARNTFGFYAISGIRSYQGSKDIRFAGDEVSAATLHSCEDVFFGASGWTRDFTTDDDVMIADIKDPATLAASSPLRAAMMTAFPDTFAMRLAEPRTPTREVQDYLSKLVASTPQAVNAVALFDPFGNLVAAAPDTLGIGSAYTAFTNTSRMFAHMRFDAVDDASTQAEARAYLTAPRHGTFVWLHAPTPGLTTTVKDLGAYASSVGKNAPGNFQYFQPPVKGTVDQLISDIADMPPYVDITPVQIAL